MSKVFAVMAAVCAMSGVVHAADTYPSRPIRMIVAYPPGGGTDQVGRVLADQLTVTLGQNVVVDNRGGATGNIGTELAARAVPDGYTLLMGNVAPNAVNVSLFKKLAFDPVKDFAPVSLVAVTPNILVAHPSMPVKTVKELIAYAKAKPGTLNFPSAGVGSSSHLAGEMLKSLAGISMVHIPFKGGGPAMVDVIAGNTLITMGSLLQLVPHVQGNRLRLLAVGSAKRNIAFPNTPTVAETVPGYEANNWWGILAPAGLSPAIVRTLEAAVKKVVEVPEMQKKFESQGAEVAYMNAATYGKFIKAETTKWSKVVSDAGIKAE